MTSALRSIDHIQLAMPRGEEARARAFFVDQLGMTEVEKPEPMRSRGGAWFSAGDVHVHVGVEDDFRPAKKAHPAFIVDDLDGLRARLTASDTPVRDGENLGTRRRFFADDPFGNRIEFMTP